MPGQKPTPDVDTDLVVLLQACSAALGNRVLDDVRSEVGDDVRYGDGYVFQHLVPGPLSISELARRMGVSQQAASKSVADLERRRLIDRRPHPDDARASLVSLSRRGRRSVTSARRSRSDILDEVTTLLGERQTAALMRSLRLISAASGGRDLLDRRTMRPESER
ncbi:MAG: MarR family transcriptional regulator [Acidimicrobiales bacterium]